MKEHEYPILITTLAKALIIIELLTYYIRTQDTLFYITIKNAKMLAICHLFIFLIVISCSVEQANYSYIYIIISLNKSIKN